MSELESSAPHSFIIFHPCPLGVILFTACSSFQKPNQPIPTLYLVSQPKIKWRVQSIPQIGCAHTNTKEIRQVKTKNDEIDQVETSLKLLFVKTVLKHLCCISWSLRSWRVPHAQSWSKKRHTPEHGSLDAVAILRTADFCGWSQKNIVLKAM